MHTWYLGPARGCLVLSLVRVLHSDLSNKRTWLRTFSHFCITESNITETLPCCLCCAVKIIWSTVLPVPAPCSICPLAMPFSSMSSKWMTWAGWILRSSWTSASVTSRAGPPLWLYCCFSFWMVLSVNWQQGQHYYCFLSTSQGLQMEISK